MAKKTLLQVAKASKTRARQTHYTREEIELALAWARDKVSWTAVSEALVATNHESHNVQNFVAYAIREAFRRGVLK